MPIRLLIVYNLGQLASSSLSLIFLTERRMINVTRCVRYVKHVCYIHNVKHVCMLCYVYVYVKSMYKQVLIGILHFTLEVAARTQG